MLEIKNVSKTFNLTGNAADTRIALDHVSLTINDGEFVTIIGGNGSGKSTLLNIITGVLYPDSGSVILGGMDITRLKEHKRANYFARVFQDPMMGTAGDMSCLENMELAFRKGKFRSPIKWGFSKSDIKEYFRHQLSEFHLGLEDSLGQKVGLMSGGQRQALTLLMAASDTRVDTLKEFATMNSDIHSGALRIQINATKDKAEKKKLNAQLKEDLKTYNQVATSYYEERKKVFEGKYSSANNIDEKIDAYIEFNNSLHDFNRDRRILLLDEHTAALDPKTSKKVLELTDKIVRTNNLTTLMITHNMKDALTYGERLIMFYQGHIILDVRGEEKEKLTVSDLLNKFDEAERMLEKWINCHIDFAWYGFLNRIFN